MKTEEKEKLGNKQHTRFPHFSSLFLSNNDTTCGGGRKERKLVSSPFSQKIRDNNTIFLPHINPHPFPFLLSVSYGAYARTVFHLITDKSKIVRGENPIILIPCMTILWFFGFFRHSFPLFFSIHIAFTPHILYSCMCAKNGEIKYLAYFLQK